MVFRVLLLAGFSVLLVNCSDMSFKSVKKQETMKQGIIADESDGGRPLVNETDGRLPNIPGVNIPGVNIPNVSLPTIPREDNDKDYRDEEWVVDENAPRYQINIDAPIFSTCSDGQSIGTGNVSTATSLTLQLVDPAGNVACQENNTSLIRQSLAQKKLVINNCTLVDASYSVVLRNENDHNLSRGHGTVRVADGVVSYEETEVLMDSNPDREDFEGDMVPAYAGSQCDRTASPLYVDLREEGDPTGVLSSPEDGVLFDILGANGTPAYSQNQISWFKRGRFGLLALPNSRGEVLGIDQLFGDNTLGPDGDFAANGFLALAKYDENGDQKIDSADPVFSSLRLWIDSNRDGKSKPRELKPLSDLRIASIDLEYDPNYRERDQHGNEIKYKSVVNFEDGEMRSIFDIWFILK